MPEPSPRFFALDATPATLDADDDEWSPFIYYAEMPPDFVSPGLRAQAARRLAAVRDTFQPLQGVPITLRWFCAVGPDPEEVDDHVDLLLTWFAARDITRQPYLVAAPPETPGDATALGFFRGADPHAIWLRAEPEVYDAWHVAGDTVTHECVHLMQALREETGTDRLPWQEAVAYGLGDRVAGCWYCREEGGWPMLRTQLLARRRRTGQPDLRLPGPLSEAEAWAAVRHWTQHPVWSDLVARCERRCHHCHRRTAHPLPDCERSFFLGFPLTLEHLILSCPRCHTLAKTPAWLARELGLDDEDDEGDEIAA